MKIGKISILKTTFIFVLIPFIFLEFPKINRDSIEYLIILLFCLFFYFVLLFGFGQVFYFKENELVVWFFNPFKKSIVISYDSINRVEIFRYMPSFVINVFHFKTSKGEIIVNNNIFSKYELKRIKKYFSSINVDCEI